MASRLSKALRVYLVPVGAVAQDVVGQRLGSRHAAIVATRASLRLQCLEYVEQKRRYGVSI
jgi:hypothetical protein